MNMASLHSSMIILHAASATLAFFAGCLLVISPTYMENRQIFRVYWWALIGMAVLLGAAILVYWTQYSAIERIIFPGLFVLSIYMLYRAWTANRLLVSSRTDWSHHYIEAIGFTLISLFEGFMIVSGLNAGFPIWLIALIAITGLLVGRWLIGSAQRKVA
jgi:hypothetical protein